MRKKKDHPVDTALCEREGCGHDFIKKRDWQRFCTRACGEREWFSTHPRMTAKEREILKLAAEAKKRGETMIPV